MEIVFENLQKKVVPNPPQILKIVKTILRHEGIETAFLTIVFVNRQRIAALNRKFLRHNYATDVLAFDFADQGKNRRHSVSKHPKYVSGDIIISTDAAYKNARTFQTGIAQELVLYIIHGILHLLGYDDHTSKDTKKMRKKEKELFVFLGNKTKNIIR